MLRVQILEAQKHLSRVKTTQLGRHSLVDLQYIHEFALGQIIHQNEHVAIVLSHPSHLDYERVIQTSHVLDLMKQMLLLLSLQNFKLADYLHSKHFFVFCHLILKTVNILIVLSFAIFFSGTSLFEECTYDHFRLFLFFFATCLRSI